MTTPTGFLQDADGNNSSMRLAFWGAFFLVGIVWAVCSFFAKPSPTMVEIPGSVVEVLGYLILGKLTQSAAVEGGGLTSLIQFLSKSREPKP